MSIIAFMPLIFMLVVIFIAMKLFVVNKKTIATKTTRLTATFTKRLLVMYVFFLVTATVVVGFTKQPSMSYEKFSNEELEQFEDVHESLINGQEEEVPSSFVVNEWTKKLEGDTFTLDSQSAHELPISFMVERTETPNEKVEATLYKGNQVVDQYQIPTYLDDIQMDWKGDTLSIQEIMGEQISISIFSYTSIFTQFSNNETWIPSKGMDLRYPVLYMKIPKSLKFNVLNIDERQIQLVE